jgi:CRISPR/Cas system-associated endonuclease/helicase Cas3
MVTDIVMSASSIIEKNQYVLKYQDQTLYNHQKQLFTMFNTAEDRPTTSKLVLYIAPTGTGKTLSPLGCRKTTA